MAADITALGDGAYRVSAGHRRATVYVARAGGDWWAFADGRVYRWRESEAGRQPGRSRRSAAGGAEEVAAPMPATVVKVLVQVGDPVKKGDTLVVLEAMKMELPLRASGDGVIAAVNCRAGDLVKPDAVLVEFAT